MALARALVKDPKILVLDEATSSPDSASEQRIPGAVELATAGRIVVSIAHRLATVKNADNIVVMRNGRVIEQGTHLELITKGADYAALVRMQSLGFETASNSSTSRDSDADMKFGLDKVSKSTSATCKKEPDATVRGASSGSEESSKPAEDITTMTLPTWATAKSAGFFARPYMHLWVLAFTAAIIVGGSYSASAILFGNTVAALSPCEKPSSIRSKGSFFALMFFVMAIIEFFANLVSWSSFGTVAEKVLYTIRTLSYRSLMEQDLHWHQSQNRTSSTLLAFITSDSTAVGGLTGSIIGTLFSIGINIVDAIVLSHVFAWKIALVCLAVVPFMLRSGIMQLRILAKFANKHEKAFEKSNGITVEAVNSIKIVLTSDMTSLM